LVFEGYQDAVTKNNHPCRLRRLPLLRRRGALTPFGTLVEIIGYYNFNHLKKDIMTNRNEKIITEKFEVILEGKPVPVKASRYRTHNKEVRFRVSINDSPVYIFAFDEKQNRAVAIDKGSAIADISPRIEEAIGSRLSKAA
jgi:hypothetical protein